MFRLKWHDKTGLHFTEADLIRTWDFERKVYTLTVWCPHFAKGFLVGVEYVN